MSVLGGWAKIPTGYVYDKDLTRAVQREGGQEFKKYADIIKGSPLRENKLGGGGRSR